MIVQAQPGCSGTEKTPAFAAVLFFLGVLLAACQESAVPDGARQGAADAAPPVEAPEAVSVQPPPPAKRRARQPDDLSKRIWWNQEDVIETLGLEAAQRRRMDELFQAFAARDEQRRERQRQTAEDYYVRLENGDWDGAREAIRKLAADGADQVSDQPQMKIDILSLLTPEQWVRFRAEYPHLFRQPWLRRMQMGAPRGPARQTLRDPNP